MTIGGETPVPKGPMGAGQPKQDTKSTVNTKAIVMKKLITSFTETHLAHQSCMAGNSS